MIAYINPRTFYLLEVRISGRLMCLCRNEAQSHTQTEVRARRVTVTPTELYRTVPENSSALL